MARSLITAFSTLLTLAAALPGTASAWEFKRDSSGTPVRVSTAMTLYVSPDFDTEMGSPGATAAVEAAAAEFQKHTGLELRVLRSAPVAGGSVVRAERDWKGQTGALATTQLTLNPRTHDIVRAEILFNTSHQRFGVAEGNAPAAFYDIQNTLTHELGHALGLEHSDDKDATMFAGALPGETRKRQLGNDDIDGLKTLYADAPNLGAGAGCGANQAPAATMPLIGLLLAARALRRAKH